MYSKSSTLMFLSMKMQDSPVRRRIINRPDTEHQAQCFLYFVLCGVYVQQLPPSGPDGCTQSLTQQTDGGGDVVRSARSESLLSSVHVSVRFRQKSHQSEEWPLEFLDFLDLNGNSDIFKPGSDSYIFGCVNESLTKGYGISQVNSLNWRPQHNCNGCDLILWGISDLQRCIQ